MIAVALAFLLLFYTALVLAAGVIQLCGRQWLHALESAALASCGIALSCLLTGSWAIACASYALMEGSGWAIRRLEGKGA